MLSEWGFEFACKVYMLYITGKLSMRRLRFCKNFGYNINRMVARALYSWKQKMKIPSDRKLPVYKLKEPLKFQKGNGMCLESDYYLHLEVHIQGFTFGLYAYITNNMIGIDLVMGQDTLAQFNGNLSFRDNIFRCKTIPFYMTSDLHLRPNQSIVKNRDVHMVSSNRLSEACPKPPSVLITDQASSLTVANHGRLLVKRYIKSITNLLKFNLIQYGTDWVRYISTCCYAYNSFVSPKLGNFSPYELNTQVCNQKGSNSTWINVENVVHLCNVVPDLLSNNKLQVTASEDFHCLDIGTSSTEQGGASGSKKIESSTEEQTESIPTDSSDNYVSYGHINYTYNIQRFFQSCPLTLSSKQCEDAELSEKDHDGKGVDEFLINIPSVQPVHSDSSSVKVNTSDLEVAVGSPRANEDSQVSDDLIPPPNPQPVFKHVNLTQAALREHTKLQKKLYLKRVKEDKNITLTKPNKNSILLKVESCRKRNRDDDKDNECPQKVKKHSSNEEVKALLEKRSSPYHSLKPIQPQYSNTIQAPYGSDYRMFPQEIPILPYGEGEDTTLTTESQYITDDREEDNGNNVKWPFYSNPGYLFSPSVMGGFYNSMPPTDDHTVTWPGPIIAGKLVKEEEGSTESVESTPTEDTSSTVPSLMDSKPNKREKHRYSKYSKYLKKSARNSASGFQSTSQVNASPKISKYDLMRYEMPIQSRKQVLKKDKEFLNNNPSALLCKEQLDCLVHDLDTVSCKKENSTKEEMMKLGQQLQAHMESSVLKEFGTASMEESKNIATLDTNETCSNTSDVDFKQDSSVTSDNSDKNTSDSTPSEHPSDSFSSVKESDGSDKPCVSKAKKIKPAKAEFHDKLFIEITEEMLTDDIDFCLNFNSEDDLNLIGQYSM
ncbi:hypothetical protein LOTGIDRAFT_234432 [Lottia gigantea]|uniref:Uncharacterized protein n=1 Tax=Lottia gigantea TaxID=225164 RepID=V3ZCS7_LOTGI|nr:hypothetical protein LOTGIDRAFT_234432 [Lottia gigantea]ESO88873.1 hypothetical protein LOTGIDRAFT_234432 [Lottia gigantea]